jgi:hypothetical protein
VSTLPAGRSWTTRRDGSRRRRPPPDETSSHTSAFRFWVCSKDPLAPWDGAAAYDGVSAGELRRTGRPREAAR